MDGGASRPAEGSLGLTAASEAAQTAAGLAVRGLAVAALEAVFEQHLSFDDFCERNVEVRGLDSRDRAFLQAVVLTALRHHGEIEGVLAAFMAKPLPRKSGPARHILAVSAAQLLYLDIPPHAAIDQAVRLARSNRNATHFSGLVNAVLRKVAGQGRQELEAPHPPSVNTPRWLFDSWSKSYGVANATAIAAAHMREPALDITVKSDPESWATRLGGIALPTGSIRLSETRGSIESLPGYGEGAWWIQDAAAALPVHLFGELVGKNVLDLCAAPGGKTMQLAASGARVTAVDQSSSRLARLRENLGRTGLKAEVVVEDALRFTAPAAFDAVLLDAPCSATGTIRRHPDLPYLKTAAQIASLAKLQGQLLDNATTLVRPGGILVFCTCSLEPAEGEEQLARFLSDHGNFEIVPPRPGEAGIEAQLVGAGGVLRTLPFQRLGPAVGLDGFFAARLTRRH